MNKIVLQIGDIRLLRNDAIVTLINPSGAWFGGLDKAIRSVAKEMYHNQARQVLLDSGLIDQQVIVATGSCIRHGGLFDNVIFVVDALISPLNVLVYAALKAAKDNGYQKIALPVMRTGVMLGRVEPDIRTVVDEMSLGIRRFFEEGDHNMTVTVVVYGQDSSFELLKESMPLLP